MPNPRIRYTSESSTSGLRIEMQDLKDELRELRSDLKKYLEQSGIAHQDMMKLLARHDEQIINLQSCDTQQEAHHENLVMRLWGLAGATLIALITIVLAFLFRQ